LNSTVLLVSVVEKLLPLMVTTVLHTPLSGKMEVITGAGVSGVGVGTGAGVSFVFLQLSTVAITTIAMNKGFMCFI